MTHLSASELASIIKAYSDLGPQSKEMADIAVSMLLAESTRPITRIKAFRILKESLGMAVDGQ